MRKTTPAPAPAKAAAPVSTDTVLAVTKRIMDRMDVQRAEITRLLRAVQAVLD
jgi:hypothetical protein